MSRTPKLRKILWILVMGSAAGSTGCIHNHYYGTVPAYPPGQTVTTRVGSVCDVPNGNIVVSGATSARVISSNVDSQPAPAGAVITSTPSDRVVIAQPSYGPPSIGQSNSRINLKKWIRPDPDAPPPMKAEGSLDDTRFQ